MSTMMILFRREFWEHRSLLYAPVIVTGILLLLYAIGLAFGLGRRFAAPISDAFDDVARETGIPMAAGERVTAVSDSLFAMTGFPTILTVAAVVLFFVVFSYAASSVFEERRDRSILFWRSLPVSDAKTLLSKWLTAIVVAPLLAAIVVSVGYLILLSMSWMVAIISDGSSDFDSAAFMTDLKSTISASGLAFYALFTSTLWLAPLIGWCMLVASWVKRSPIVSAAIPVVLVALGSVFVMPGHGIVGWIWGNFFLTHEYVDLAYRASSVELGSTVGELLAGTRQRAVSFDFFGSLADPASFFASVRVWLGLLVSALLLGCAIYIRRYRDEAL